MSNRKLWEEISLRLKRKKKEVRECRHHMIFWAVPQEVGKEGLRKKTVET